MDRHIGMALVSLSLGVFAHRFIAGKPKAKAEEISQPKASVYERLEKLLGGDPTDALGTLVQEFYKRILADEALAPFFHGLDMAKQHRHLGMFIKFAIGAPGASYSGRSMAKAHAKPRANGLNEDHFNKVAGHLIEAMRGLGLPRDIIDDTLAIVATTKDAVVYGRE